jgi:hypothetical protein
MLVNFYLLNKSIFYSNKNLTKKASAEFLPERLFENRETLSLNLTDRVLIIFI